MARSIRQARLGKASSASKGGEMKCPHCRENFHDAEKLVPLGKDVESFWAVATRVCPACQKLVILLENGRGIYGGGSGFILNPVHGRRLVRPKASLRPPCPAEVPGALAEDYKEACLVFADSPKASAALSR